MIPILFNQEETSFSTNGLGKLSEASRCIVTEERNGIYELEMTYPIDGRHISDIVVDNYIYAIPFANGSPQIFRIYEITKPISGFITVYAEHISYQLRMIPVMPFSAVGANAALQALKANAVEACPFEFWTDIESTRRYTLSYPDAIRGKLQGDQWGINQNFGGEYEFDNYTVKLWEHRGSDKGVVLRYGTNISNLKQETNIQNTYTGIVPYWYGFSGSGDEQVAVTLPEKALYSENASNFPYGRTIAVDFTEDFSEKPTVDELRARGQRYLNENEIGIPRVSVNVSFVDLTQTEDYKNVGALATVNLCDTITVAFEKLGITTKDKVTRTKWDVLLDRYEEIYIGGAYTSLAGTIAEQGTEISAMSKISDGLITSTLFSGTFNSTSATETLTKGMNWSFLIFLGRPGEAINSSLVVPVANISTTPVKYQLAGQNGYFAISLVQSGDDVIMTYDSTSSTTSGRITRVYGIG